MIGVVAPCAEVGAFEDAILEAGETPYSGSAGGVLESDPDAVLAVGEAGVTNLIRAADDVAPPVLAVGIATGPDGDAATGHPAAPEPEGNSAIEALASGEYRTVPQPVLGADVDDERAGRAAFDAMIVTSDPGGISEYRIVAGADLGAVRADGVVVATPAGSQGYARAAGGPRIVADAPVGVVVPVAPFTMAPERWVVDLDPPIEISSERDVDVSLVLDEKRRGIRSDATVSIGLDGTLSRVVPEGGTARRGRGHHPK